MASAYSGIRCQLRKSSTNAPGSPGRVPLRASGPGSARLRSTPASSIATCSGPSTPRSSTTPSRRKSSTSCGSTAGTARKTTLPGVADPIEWIDGALEADCRRAGSRREAAGAAHAHLGAGARDHARGCRLRAAFLRDLGERCGSRAPTEAIEEHLELGIGLRGSVECLGRIDRARVRTLLEVGCGTGLTLDFAARARLGGARRDTSAMSGARRGARRAIVAACSARAPRSRRARGTSSSPAR